MARPVCKHCGADVERSNWPNCCAAAADGLAAELADPRWARCYRCQHFRVEHRKAGTGPCEADTGEDRAEFSGCPCRRFRA